MSLLPWLGFVLHLGVFVVLLCYAWEDREDELHEETMRARAFRRVGDDEENQWL